MLMHVPNHPFILLLFDVGRDLAVYLARVESHSQRFGHVGLYGSRNTRVLVGRTNPEFGRACVLEFASTQLRQLGCTNEGKNDIGGKARLEI